MWAETNQSIFFIESGRDCGRGPLHCLRRHRFLLNKYREKGRNRSKLLAHSQRDFSQDRREGARSKEGNDNDIYLYKTVGQQMIWPYDDRGDDSEDVYEPGNSSKAELFKLDPADVLHGGNLLAVLFIKPLPSFDEYVLWKSAAAGR